MPLQLSQRRVEDAPSPSAAGKVNPDLGTLIYEMKLLAPGMVLEIETEGGKSVRSTKVLISKAAKVLGTTLASLERWNNGVCPACGPKQAPRPTQEGRLVRVRFSP